MDGHNHLLPPYARDADDRMSLDNADESKQTYKSWKKKYKKMKMKFDEKMRQSNQFFVEEQMALRTARRLAQENDRLLELLLDINESAQIPADKRIDLDVDIPSLSAVPSLISPDDLSRASEVDSVEGLAIYNEIKTMLEEKAALRTQSKPPRSLTTLITTVPHHSLQTPLPSPNLLSNLETPEGLPAPISYLTPDQVDDYLYDIDASLGLVPPTPSHNQESTLHEDLQLKNPNSVYNWLRRNEPKIFLQDGEGSEKSQGKPGALRGAGKRASLPAPAKHDSLEFVEEDGIGYDPAFGGPVTKGKRKRDEDDTGYHPKKGNLEKKPRMKRKKTEGDSAGSADVKKGKGKGKGRPSSPSPREQGAFAA